MADKFGKIIVSINLVDEFNIKWLGVAKMDRSVSKRNLKIIKSKYIRQETLEVEVFTFD